jgi:hypothetical protein
MSDNSNLICPPLLRFPMNLYGINQGTGLVAIFINTGNMTDGSVANTFRRPIYSSIFVPDLLCCKLVALLLLSPHR